MAQEAKQPQSAKHGIGERVKRLRDRKELDQDELGRLLDPPLSGDVIYDIEAERRKAWRDHGLVKQLAQALDTTEAYLLLGLQIPDEVREETKPYLPQVQSMGRGDLAILPVWRGIVAGFTDECYFLQPDSAEFIEVPAFLIVGDPNGYVVCIPAGISMAPRIQQGWRVIVKLDPNPPTNTLIVAENPDRRRFVKALRFQMHRYELHSVDSDKFPPITDLTGWTFIGSVIGIWAPYDASAPNIEWNGGSPLRA